MDREQRDDLTKEIAQAIADNDEHNPSSIITYHDVRLAGKIIDLILETYELTKKGA